MEKFKYKVTITDYKGNELSYERESIFRNFYDAIHNDMKDIRDIICSSKCLWYDFELIQENSYLS